MIRPKTRGTVVIPIAHLAEQKAFDSYFSDLSHGICRKEPYAVTEYDVSGIKAYATYVGAGSVCAATGTQFLVDAFQPDLVLHFGHAWPLDESLEINKVYAIEKARPYGIAIPQSTPYPNHYPQSSDWIACDASYTRRLYQICDIPSETLISCDSPIEHENRAHYASEAGLVDFEGAAIGYVAMKNNTPLVMLKMVTDLDLDAANTFRLGKGGVINYLLATVSTFFIHI